MDTIYDTLAKLNRVANRPKAKKIVKEDSHGMMKKGLKDLISKQKDKSGYDKAVVDASKMNQKYKPFGKGDSDYVDGLPKDLKEKESDVKRDDHDEEAGRKVAHDAKYDGRRHAGKDGDDVVKDLEYDQKNESSGGTLKDAARAGVMARLAELAGLPAQEIEEALGDSPQDTASRIMSEVSLDEDESEDELAKDILDNPGWDHYFDPNRKINNEEDEGDKPTADQLMKLYKTKGEDALRIMMNMDQKRFSRMLTFAGGDVNSLIQDYVGESVNEEDTNEGNEFSGALAQAKKDGKAEFTVDGKKYKVEAIDSDEDAIQESDIDQIADVGKVYPKIAKMKMKLVDDGMEPEDAHDEACEKYNVDPAMCDKYIEMQRDDRETKKVSEGGGRDMECSHCDGTGKHGDKDCKKCDGTGEAQDDDDPMNNESKVEETTSAGAVADGAGSGSSPYKNASVYESNEIVKRARQLNEDMSFTVSGGPDQEPTLNINASGQEAQQLAQLLKLSGLAMTAQQPQYGEVEIQVAEDQEFANGDQNEQTADTNTLVNAISGGLNGQKKMAYPRASQGDNAMATLGESELVATSANQLLKQYEAFKAK